MEGEEEEKGEGENVGRGPDSSWVWNTPRWRHTCNLLAEVPKRVGLLACLLGRVIGWQATLVWLPAAPQPTPKTVTCPWQVFNKCGQVLTCSRPLVDGRGLGQRKPPLTERRHSRQGKTLLPVPGPT